MGSEADLPVRLRSQNSNSLIESRRQKFALTGSSARKLKRGHANLLGGRANLYALFPFSSGELGDAFDLDTALNWGTLPYLAALASDIPGLKRKLLLSRDPRPQLMGGVEALHWREALEEMRKQGPF